jgi:hypothetical protein
LAGCIGGLVEPPSLPPPPPQAAKSTEITTGQITGLNADFMAIFLFIILLIRLSVEDWRVKHGKRSSLLRQHHEAVFEFKSRLGFREIVGWYSRILFEV